MICDCHSTVVNIAIVLIFMPLSLPLIHRNEPTGVNSLRKVLRAYALRNEKVGYCQSMNFICALLLFHLSEERAFWVMAAVIEDILPWDYYESSLIGAIH